MVKIPKEEWEREEREYQKVKKMIDKKEKKELERWLRNWTKRERRDFKFSNKDIQL